MSKQNKDKKKKDEARRKLEKLLVKKPGQVGADPGDFRTASKNTPGMAVELSGGTVIIQPEGPDALYASFQAAGVKIDMPEVMKPEYDEDGDPKGGRILEMSWKTRDMFDNLPEIVEQRACAITLNPKILPTPRDEKGNPIPTDQRDKSFLYWDELNPVDRRVLENILQHEEISASGARFR